MKILFDQGTPVPLRKHLPEHQISTAFELGWTTLNNGELLSKAESDGFEVVVTTDQHVRYQQNFKTRQIAIVVLLSTSWPKIQAVIPEICVAVNSTTSNSYIEISVPSCR